MKLLLDMLRYKRRHKTKSERRFTTKFIDSVEGMTQDGFGNRILRVGENNGLLFSCHLDTVHGRNGMQKVVVDPIRKEVYKDDKNPLGADDAAGIWLMLNMIKAKVPGLYIFHRGEEKGGLGSRWILKNTPRLLDGITKAVAFDRCGTSSVITRQGFSRCCSDNFAKELSHELFLQGLVFTPDDTGVFTDTAVYTDVIPECTNVSVGYENEHTARETLDYGFLMRLGEAVCKLDWNGLCVERTAGDDDYSYRGGGGYGYGQGSIYGSMDDWRDDHMYATPSRGTSTFTPKPLDHDNTYQWVFSNPDAATTLLIQLGATAEDINASCYSVDDYQNEDDDDAAMTKAGW